VLQQTAKQSFKFPPVSSTGYEYAYYQVLTLRSSNSLCFKKFLASFLEQHKHRGSPEAEHTCSTQPLLRNTATRHSATLLLPASSLRVKRS